MIIKQISVFVENKPGRLAEITQTLAQCGINIRALSIADTTDFGILRLIVNAPSAAETCLRQAGFMVSLTAVIAVGISDTAGSLAKLLDILYHEGITIEYMYAFVSKSDMQAGVAMRVENEKKAVEVLKKAGYEPLKENFEG